MPKIPYGFDSTFPYLNDDGLHELSTEDEAWVRLGDVQGYLERQKPLPPELAHWLGEAIRHSNKDHNELLQRLGLKRRTGERGRYSRRFKEYWKNKLWYLGTSNKTGQHVEQIISCIQAEMTKEGIKSVPDRQTLQDWFHEAMTSNKRIR